MTEIEKLKQSVLIHLALADEMTDFDAYAYLQLLDTTAWQYIKHHYDEEYKT